jgi:hypothetical protein
VLAGHLVLIAGAVLADVKLQQFGFTFAVASGVDP